MSDLIVDDLIPEESVNPDILVPKESIVPDGCIHVGLGPFRWEGENGDAESD